MRFQMFRKTRLFFCYKYRIKKGNRVTLKQFDLKNP